MALPGVRPLAIAAALASWALVGVGGIVRASESGLGCPDWPLCEGRLVPDGGRAPAIEFSHRAAAALATVLVLATAVQAVRERRRGGVDVAAPAIAAAAFLPAQALLGAVVVWLELPAAVVGLHFVVGMLLLAATVVTAVRSDGRPRRQAAPEAAAVAAAAGLALVLVGTAVVAADADGACGREWPLCNGGLAAGGPEAALHAVHRLLAYLVIGLALVAFVAARRRRGAAGPAAAVVLAGLGQAAVGVAMVSLPHGSAAHEPLEAAHVAGAATVWALLVRLATPAMGKDRAAARAPAAAAPATEG